MDRDVRGLESLKDLFDAFHDGAIETWRWDRARHTLTLGIEIEYLARLTGSCQTRFEVTLLGVRACRFEPWCGNGSGGRDRPGDVFAGDLEILSATVERARLNVLCLEHSPAPGGGGGNLVLACDRARVKDPAGRAYSIDEFQALARRYWTTWSRRGWKIPRPGP